MINLVGLNNEQGIVLSPSLGVGPLAAPESGQRVLSPSSVRLYYIKHNIVRIYLNKFYVAQCSPNIHLTTI